MVRYVGTNPKHAKGEDWRSPRLQEGNPRVPMPDTGRVPLGMASPRGGGGGGGGD